MRRRININKNNNENKYFNEKKTENKNWTQISELNITQLLNFNKKIIIQ